MSTDPDLISGTFRALSDPGRRHMLERLSQGPTSVSELGRPLNMSLAAVVQHVQVLVSSGLVRTRKSGRVRTCTLVSEAMRPAEEWLAGHRATWERRLDLLGAVLDEDDRGPTPGAVR